MATKTFQGRVVMKHDTQANWNKATNFVPLAGEIIVYDDLRRIKIGDGKTKVKDLQFSTPTQVSDLSQLTNDKKDFMSIKGIYTYDKNGFNIGLMPNVGTILGVDPNNDNVLYLDYEQDNRFNLMPFNVGADGNDYESKYIISNIDMPIQPYDVANKGYVDDQIAQNASSTKIKTWSETT